MTGCDGTVIDGFGPMLPLRGTGLGALPPPGADILNHLSSCHSVDDRESYLVALGTGDIHRVVSGRSGAATQYSHGPRRRSSDDRFAAGISQMLMRWTEEEVEVGLKE